MTQGETLRTLDAEVAERPAVAPPIMGSKYQEAEGDLETCKNLEPATQAPSAGLLSDLGAANNNFA